MDDRTEQWRALVEDVVADELDVLHELLSGHSALAGELSRISVVVRDHAPTDEPDLLGSYQGVPAGDQEVGLMLPPLVEIYLLPHLEFCSRPDSHLIDPDVTVLDSEIRITLRHEIGHHLGLDHERLAILGLD
jgi:predicted Zn-dependent protease with MMP-like domain